MNLRNLKTERQILTRGEDSDALTIVKTPDWRVLIRTTTTKKEDSK